MTNQTGHSATVEQDRFGVTPLSPSLPKGGGAIRRSGEKFSANPVTGSSTFSIPLPASPGRGGFGPPLAFSYDSGSGNGPFGFGWSIALPAITRRRDKGLRDAAELIRVGRIEAVDSASVPGAQVLDLDGQWLLRGLIDSQAHLFNLAGAPRTRVRRNDGARARLVAFCPRPNARAGRGRGERRAARDRRGIPGSSGWRRCLSGFPARLSADAVPPRLVVAGGRSRQGIDA